MERSDRIYILWYDFRHLGVQTKIFWFKGNLTDAISHARRHCGLMNYNFIKVRPYVVDLEEQEKRRQEYESYENYEDSEIKRS